MGQKFRWEYEMVHGARARRSLCMSRRNGVSIRSCESAASHWTTKLTENESQVTFEWAKTREVRFRGASNMPVVAASVSFAAEALRDPPLSAGVE